MRYEINRDDQLELLQAAVADGLELQFNNDDYRNVISFCDLKNNQVISFFNYKMTNKIFMHIS